MRDAKAGRHEDDEREHGGRNEEPVRVEPAVPSLVMLGVKSGSARIRGALCSGAKIAAGTNESISQRPRIRLNTAVNEIAPSFSVAAGCSSRSTLISFE